jgi:hypothetical protein
MPFPSHVLTTWGFITVNILGIGNIFAPALFERHIHALDLLIVTRILLLQ